MRLFGQCLRFESQQSKRTFHKGLVLLLTYIAYAAFHMGRRPLSIVKNVLNQDCSKLHNSTHIVSNDTTDFPAVLIEPIDIGASNSSTDNSCDWAPFDDDATANQLLAVLDTSFLASYAVFMFFSGIIAERVNLRYYITVGSMLSGLGLIAFGLAYPLQIHSMVYFVLVQIASGAFQTTGWPVAVTCVGNWFEPARRGLIYGLWNSHTNVGNILGATIAGFFVDKNWALSFIVPGLIMIVVGVIQFLFLVPQPNNVGLQNLAELRDEEEQQRRRASTLRGYSNPAMTYAHHDESMDEHTQDGQQPTKAASSIDESEHKAAVSFWTALKIPGVIEFSLCLFFSKLVNYTFLYWLPRYITYSTHKSSEDSAYLSVPFDLGGMAGAVLVGYLSDRFKVNGIILSALLLLAIPSLFAYQQFGALSNFNNIALQMLVGSLVNGPYCLITTSVSADLGNRITDGRAMATVTAIIDGMGSIGAVLGPLFAGFASNSGGNWQDVFIMLMVADLMAIVCLLRITVRETREKCAQYL